MATKASNDRSNDSAGADVVKCLSPSGDITGLVAKSVKAYRLVKDASDELLTRSSLDLDAFKGATDEGGDAPISMRQLVVKAYGDFTQFAQGEVDLCNNLKAYGGLLLQVLPELNIRDMVEMSISMIGPYQEAMASASKARGDSASKVIAEIDEIILRVSDATVSIGLLSKQAASMEAQLAREHVGKRLIEALKKLFRLVDDEDGALVQISVILGVGIGILRGDFGSLFKDNSQAKAFITRVDALKASLVGCGSSLRMMTDAMRIGVQANISMVDIWDNLMANVKMLKSSPNQDDTITTSQKLSITMNWTQTLHKAGDAVNVLTGAISRKNRLAKNSAFTSFTVANFTTSSPRTMKVPQSTPEISLLKLAGSYGLDVKVVNPERYRVMASLASDTDFMNRQINKFASANANFMAVDGEEESDPDTEELMKKFGAPGVEEQLKDLAGDCAAVNMTFDTILQIPFLQNLSILNPFHTGRDSETKDIDMRTLFTRYQTKYDTLQEKTKECVRHLIAYAAMQLTLLPIVEVDPTKVTKGSLNISTKDYLEACAPAIAKYLQLANDLRHEHTAFNNEWKLAQTNITQKVNESNTNAARLKGLLEADMEKYKNQTLWGVLKFIGGAACFSLTFIAPFLAPVTIGVGVGLMYWGIKDLMERGQLDAGIASLQTQIDAAANTASQLKQLKAPMDIVENKLAQLINIWNNISQNLTNINLRMHTFARIGPDLLVKLWKQFSPLNEKEWADLKDNCTAYANAIKGSA